MHRNLTRAGSLGINVSREVSTQRKLREVAWSSGDIYPQNREERVKNVIVEVRGSSTQSYFIVCAQGERGKVKGA